ncbi:MAG: GNAT family N-acetyltransferase [Actinomycetota bacterium]|nr:GNAT family N-acetyltransferase [Actinomycetota bacterium]
MRSAVLDDLTDLLRVYDETRATEPTAEERQTWQAMSETDNLRVYCAQMDEQLVGTASLLVMSNLTYACEPTAFIEAVVVRERWRRRGIATAMMKRVLDDARAAGCNKVQLLSHKRHADESAHELLRGSRLRSRGRGLPSLPHHRAPRGPERSE